MQAPIFGPEEPLYDPPASIYGERGIGSRSYYGEGAPGTSAEEIPPALPPARAPRSGYGRCVVNLGYGRFEYCD